MSPGRLKALYRRQMFFPSGWGVLVNPFYLARAGLVRSMRELAPRLSGRLLDVGCGTKPYAELFDVDVYVGLEIDTEVARQRGGADCYYEGGRFPFEDQAFDAILCNQVLEHVFNPDEFLSELHRVLKGGGRLLLSIPFVWDEHEQPYDYARYSSFGLAALLEKRGFHVVVHQRLGADASIIFQLINAYLFKVTQRWPRLAQLLLTMTVMALMNGLGVCASRLLPRNPDLFLDHVVLAEKAS